MHLIFNEWPDRKDVTELWLTKIEGEGVISQVSLDFSRAAAEEKAAELNANLPGVAVSLIGPYKL